MGGIQIGAACAVICMQPASMACAQEVASAEQIAEAMSRLSGEWSGDEYRRENGFSGDWTLSDAVFNFTFDASAMRGEVLNEGEPPFTVTARDDALHYAGEVRGTMMEQERAVVEFWPVGPDGNMMLVAEYAVPSPQNGLVAVRETYQLYEGTYIRRQEFRLAGSEEPFTLIRDARFTRAD